MKNLIVRTKKKLILMVKDDHVRRSLYDGNKLIAYVSDEIMRHAGRRENLRKHGGIFKDLIDFGPLTPGKILLNQECIIYESYYSIHKRFRRYSRVILN